MKRTPALARIEKKLARDRSAILTTAEVQLLARAVVREFRASFSAIAALSGSQVEDAIRWRALAARCAEAGGRHGLRDMASITRIPLYRLRAIEAGHLPELRGDLAWRYIRALGIEEFARRWCRANTELARRAGLVDSAPRKNLRTGASRER